MIRTLASVTIAILLGLPSVGMAGAARGAESHASVPTHRATGIVSAVSMDASVPVIVLRLGSGESETVIGATIDSQAVIRRGRAAIKLDQLRVGDHVQLTYRKTKSGLVATSIVTK